MNYENKTFGVYKISQKEYEQRLESVDQAFSHVISDDHININGHVKRVYEEYVAGNIKDADALNILLTEAATKDALYVLTNSMHQI